VITLFTGLTIAFLSLGVIAVVHSVGVERPPLTPGIATFAAIANILIILNIMLLYSRALP